ncbi:hypothetical protein GQ54DRAFT_299579 [Martensiomyces pterosporus]|nr:hypothetical protein GQ54DRAFT_299579 [Martensiomyces pterosporus]
MSEAETPRTAVVPAAASTKCEQCTAAEAKYKCPGCMVRTCSLACSKKHKELTGCTGQRDRTKFIKRAEYDANTLMSDYGFLQDLARDHTNLICDAKEQGIAGNTNKRGYQPRQNKTSGGSSDGGPPGAALNRAQKNIVARAKAQREVQIRYMSPGMQRHQQNKTLWSSSKSRLVWTIEIIVPEITESPNRWVETGFHDVCQLGDLWSRLLESSSNAANTADDGKESEPHPRKRARYDGARIQLPSDDGTEYPFKSSIQPELLHALKERFGDMPLQSLSWLLRIQDVPSNTPTLRRIDPCKPLFTQLQLQTVLEFPTFYVYRDLPSKLGGYDVTIQEQ